MERTKIFDPSNGSKMRLGIFMSGAGTNAVKILEHQEALKSSRRGSPYYCSVIFTDNKKESNRAEAIGERFDVPVVTLDFKEFCRKKNLDPKDVPVRQYYYDMVLSSLSNWKLDVVALAGFMLIVTDPLISEFNGRMVNIHPADLSIRDTLGRAKYTGANAVAYAIMDGMEEIRATTHLVTNDVDQGNPLLISHPVKVHRNEILGRELKEVASEYQEKLKVVGDWIIYPRTVEYIAAGLFSRDAENVTYFHETPIPFGFKIG